MPGNDEISLFDTSNTYTECLNIINDKKTLNHNDLSIKWVNFKQQFPQLYEMLTISENTDLKLLKFLCDLSEKQNKLTTTDKRIENDFEVGDKLAHNYVYDKFPEPSLNQQEYIKESIRNKIKKGESYSIPKK